MSLRKARSTPKIRRASLIRGRKIPQSGISYSRHFLRRQPTLPACRRYGLRSTPCNAASRTAAGRGKCHTRVALASGVRVVVNDLRSLPDYRDRCNRPPLCCRRQGGRYLVFSCRLPAFPAGSGPDGCEFVICFDDGAASEFNTLLVTDWFAHTPPPVLAANFGVSADTFAKTPLNDLWIFQGKVPGDLPAVRKAMTGNAET